MGITNLEKSNILVEALPYVNRFRDNIIVIKYGGNAMVNEELKTSVMKDVHLMKSVGMHPVIVHGGGPAINKMLDRLNIESHFEQGLRVTTDEIMEISEMVLNGQVNKDIVTQLNMVGADAIGLSGKDGSLIRANKKYLEAINEDGIVEQIDIGAVGEVVAVNTKMLEDIINRGSIPVISSVGIGENGESYNINADYVAGAIASALDADKFILLTDVKGIYKDLNDESTFMSRLDVDQVNDLIADGTISGGMLPKVDCCLNALEGGVDHAHIIDGRQSHSLLLEIFFDDGVGTMIVKAEGEDQDD